MKKLSLIIALSSLAFAGCKKDLLDTVPYGQLASANMWTSDNLTDQGVNAIYQALRLGQATSGWPSFLELYHYDRLGSTGLFRGGDGFVEGSITPGDGLFAENWRNLYTGIIRANDALANIPTKSPTVAAKKARLIAETKFLRAYFYLRLNQLYRGVPVYLEPTAYDQFLKPRSTEQEVWNVIISDLNDAINEPNLPNRYARNNANFGRVTKGAALALRGKTYLYTKEWAKAAADFAAVAAIGYSLFPNYGQLFKEANEQSDEMIFSIQNIGIANLGSTNTWLSGTRSSFGGGWNLFVPSPSLVDSYENINGTRFNWDDVIPGYSSMTPAARQVYFLRDNLTAAEISAAATRGADMSRYLPTGNEARIRAAYQNRDPRLAATVITPYATYAGVVAGANQTVTSRFPFRSDLSPTFDLRSDQTGQFYHLYRKFVAEGNTEALGRAFGPIDFPLIRYADVLLMWAEALNEMGNTTEALTRINQVRTRAGVPALQQSNAALGAFVTGQANLRERIYNERKVEFAGEGITYFDELRWRTWGAEKFRPGAGVQYVWGQNDIAFRYGGDYMMAWPIPTVEIQRNPNLVQNPGWPN